jgi:hypothetical protein
MTSSPRSGSSCAALRAHASVSRGAGRAHGASAIPLASRTGPRQVHAKYPDLTLLATEATLEASPRALSRPLPTCLCPVCILHAGACAGAAAASHRLHAVERGAEVTTGLLCRQPRMPCVGVRGWSGTQSTLSETSTSTCSVSEPVLRLLCVSLLSCRAAHRPRRTASTRAAAARAVSQVHRWLDRVERAAGQPRRAGLPPAAAAVAAVAAAATTTTTTTVAKQASRRVPGATGVHWAQRRWRRGHLYP